MAHSSGVFAAIPAFIGGLVALKSESLPIGAAAIAGGIVAMALVQTFLVPLVRAEA